MSVCCGATVTLSPVWTPIGSMFSIEHTTSALSLWSRITSSSNSPQPISDCSSRTWLIGLALRPSETRSWNSASVRATPPPCPPSVKAGRTISGQADVLDRARGLRDRGHDRRARDAQAGLDHRLAKQLAVLGAVDRVVVRSDQLDAEALERAVLVERLGEVERRLAAERAEQRVGALALDHGRHRLRRERLDVGRGRELRVGHDRRRVGVHEHDLVALLHQHLARLHAGVVELGGLADHDRAGADQQDAVDVGAPRHVRVAVASGGSHSTHASTKPIEQVQRVVRAWACLGVVLDAGARHVAQHESLDGAVVEVHVRQLGGAEVGLPPQRLVAGDRVLAPGPDDGEAVVLGGDLDLAGREVLDGMVGTAVAERELEGLEPDRPAQQLVAEADAEHRHLADQLAHVADDVVERGRVARAVGEEDGVGLRREHVLGARRAGEQVERQPARGEVARRSRS